MTRSFHEIESPFDAGRFSCVAAVRNPEQIKSLAGSGDDEKSRAQPRLCPCTFATLRPLPISDRDMDVEMLRYAVRPRCWSGGWAGECRGSARAHWAFLAALLHQFPRDMPRRVQLLVRLDTVRRWHRVLVARRHAARSRPKRPGRPRTVHSIRTPMLRLARRRRELLDRALIRRQRHLLYALSEFEAFYNEHRPYQGIANARPSLPDQHGQGIRQAQRPDLDLWRERPAGQGTDRSAVKTFHCRFLQDLTIADQLFSIP
ncbi:hypothetical protein [Streptomyces sp. 900105755]